MSRAQSRPFGFDPRAHSVLLAGGTRAKGPPLCGVAITARRAGAVLTGLATTLAVGSRRSGVVITAPKAGAIFAPPLRFGRSIARSDEQHSLMVAREVRAEEFILERQIHRT